MAKISEILKAAVENENWQPICDLYQAMTGETLEIPGRQGVVDWSEIDFNVNLDASPHGNLPPIKTPPVDSNTPVKIVDFMDDSEGETDENVAKTLVQNEHDHIGEGEDIISETPIAKDPEAAHYIASSKNGNWSGGSGRKQRMIIPKSGKRQNRFTDNLEAVANERVDINPNMGVSRIAPRGRASERGSNTYKIKVVCTLCKKELQVAPTLAVGYDPNPDHNAYKCNECNTRAGREKYRREHT